MGATLGGGGMAIAGEGADALCAEFGAGKEGGGRWSSSSSELSCSASEKVGTAPFAPSDGAAFGVPSGDKLLLACLVSLSDGSTTDVSWFAVG